MPRHTDPVPRLSVLLSGRVEETAARRTVVGGVGSLIFKREDVAHEDRFGGEGARLLSVELDEALVSGLSFRWAWRSDRSSLAAALDWLHCLELEAGEAETALVELLVLVACSPSEPERSGEPPAWLRTVRQSIEDAPVSVPPVGELARRAERHPVYLARAFRRYFGLSISEAVRGARVRWTLDRLSSRKARPLAEVALEAGYFDQSHMCRDFRLELERSPAQVRRLLGRFVGSSIVPRPVPSEAASSSA